MSTFYTASHSGAGPDMRPNSAGKEIQVKREDYVHAAELRHATNATHVRNVMERSAEKARVKSPDYYRKRIAAMDQRAKALGAQPNSNRTGVASGVLSMAAPLPYASPSSSELMQRMRAAGFKMTSGLWSGK